MVIGFPLRKQLEGSVRISRRYFAVIALVIGCGLGLDGQTPARARKPATAVGPVAQSEAVTNPVADPKALSY
jgi:hypothetical protein